MKKFDFSLNSIVKASFVLCIIIIVFAIAMIAGLFTSKYYLVDEKINSPEATGLSIPILDRLLVSPKSDLYSQIVSLDSCNLGADRIKINLEEPTEVSTYYNYKNGLQFKIPYNSDWGAPYFRFEAYDDDYRAIIDLYSGELLKQIFFGKPIIMGCDGTGRQFRLVFAPAEPKEDLVARIERSYSGWDHLEIEELDIEGKEVVKFLSYEGHMSDAATVVIGQKYNYFFQQRYNFLSDDEATGIIQSIRFL